MKRTKEDAEATRVQILETSAREFRANGLHFSVADLMKSAGLTHGGFYRHFESKDHLVAEACQTAMSSLIESLNEAAQGSKKQDRLRRLIEYYLSPAHRNNCSEGCPMAALGSELSRSELQVRRALTVESNRLIEFIGEMIDGAKYKHKRSEAQFIFASMVGAMTMARLMTSAVESNEFLSAARARLIDQYCL